jgi:hypothetical protein
MSALTVKRGDTWVWPFTYKDEAGTPIDLSGSSVRLHLKAKRATTPAVSASTATGEITLTPLDGVATVRIEPAVTELVAPAKYDADIEVTWSDGTVQSSATFSVVVQEDVTV